MFINYFHTKLCPPTIFQLVITTKPKTNYRFTTIAVILYTKKVVLTKFMISRRFTTTRILKILCKNIIHATSAVHIHIIHIVFTEQLQVQNIKYRHTYLFP